MWGGVECSLVRIGDGYRNQFEETGHQHSLADLDAIASLGIRTLRYPVLWEAVSPDYPDTCDWSFSDERLARLRALGITPIAGLLHQVLTNTVGLIKREACDHVAQAHHIFLVHHDPIGALKALLDERMSELVRLAILTLSEFLMHAHAQGPRTRQGTGRCGSRPC